MCQVATGAKAGTKTKARVREPRARLSPEARRRQLLDVAAALLTERGAEHVQVTDLADVAGVTRPVVYRYFPTRAALIVAVVEDFEQMLEARYAAAFTRALPSSLEGIVRVFIVASCDAIDERGAGSWYLLDARTSDPEVGKVGEMFHVRLLAPWRARLSELSGASELEVDTVLRVVVASARAVLDRYIEGVLAREAAIELATFVTTALLEAFERRTQSNLAP